MKNINIYIYVISFAVLISCSGDDDGGSGSGTVSENEPPTTPSLTFPINNESCTNFNLEFTWNQSSDPDSDSISYVIEIATDDEFTIIPFTANTTNTQRTLTLEKGVTYYWRVKASDSKGNESEYSSIQSFFTEPDANIDTLPSTPQLIGPAIGLQLSGNTVVLDWEATDVDGDSILYDVYFGNTNPPTLFSENMDVSALEVAISPNTLYYWQVVITDNQQNTSIGQVWNFRTE